MHLYRIDAYHIDDGIHKEIYVLSDDIKRAAEAVAKKFSKYRTRMVVILDDDNVLLDMRIKP